MRGGRVLRRRAARVASAVLLAAVAAAVVQPGAQAQTPGPTVTVTPSTDLTDGTVVTIDGSGFTPNLQVIAAVCGPRFDGTAGGIGHCALFNGSAFGTTDDQGTVQMTLRIDAVLWLQETVDVGGQPTTRQYVHDCRTGGCRMSLGSLGGIADIPLGFDPDAPLSGTATATPATGLVDGQRVTLQGSGFNPLYRGTVRQCVDHPTEGVLCQARWSPGPSGGDGTFGGSHRVDAIMSSEEQPGVRGEDCRVTGRCLLRISSNDPTEKLVDIPLSFDPDGPLAPPPVVTVEPNQDLIDQEQVTVAGSGYDNEAVELRQCAPNGDWYDTCTFVGWGYAFASEGFTTTVRLAAILDFPASGRIDCRTSAQPCQLQASPSGVSSRLSRVDLHFDPEGPDPTDPNAPAKVTVSPATDLAHLQTVQVTASGFAPNTPEIKVEQCGGPVGDACIDLGRTQSDRAGKATADVLLRADFERGIDEIIDCRAAPGCRIVVSAGEKRGSSSDLAFAPSARRRYVDRVFDTTEVTTVDYRQTTNSQGQPVTLSADVYQPAGDTAVRRPVLVWNDAGLWFIKLRTLGFYQAMLRDFTRRGYVVVFMDVSATSSFINSTFDFTNPNVMNAANEAYDDITAGVGWLRDHADEYRIDPDAIAVGGSSTGGVTAFDMAYRPGQRGPATSQIAAALSVSGAGIGTPEVGEPPVLAFHGTADAMVPISRPRATCEAATAVGLRCDVIAFEGAPHLLRSPAEWILEIGYRDEVVQAGAEFLKEVMVDFDVTADAGGPYSVAEGSTVTLDGSGSSGDGLAYSWAPADRVDDPTSATPTLRGIDDGTETLTLTVTDAHGISDSATVEVTTTNAPPAIPTLTVTATGQTVDVQAAITDPGAADTHTVLADWGDGTTSPLTVSSLTATGSHQYSEPGRYTVKVTATDDDGASATAERQVVVGCTIVGTDRNDLLIGTRGADVICGLDGHDLIAGLDGNDRIYGGPGNDVLHGGPGNDLLVGGPGLDWAIGAEGTNTCTAEIRRSCTARN